MTQIIAMAKQLQEQEVMLAELRSALTAATAAQDVPTQHTSSPFARAAAGVGEVPPGSAGIIGHVGRSQSEAASPTLYDEPSRGTSSPPEERLLSDLSLDENGKLCYYGPTSAVYEPAALETRSDGTPNFDEQSSKSDARSLLTSNALESRTWEAFALGNAAQQTDIPRDIISRLLQIHWAWIAPMFMWVYRPAFMRTYGVPCEKCKESLCC
jgi:hypothetical protein